MGLRLFMIGAVTIGAVTIGAVLGACSSRPRSDHGAPEECRACHEGDYELAPKIPSHVATLERAQCGDCHAQDQWSPALASDHPSDRFPLGAPHDYACLDCHDLASGKPSALNTDCVGCHEGAHAEALAAQRHEAVPQYVFHREDPSFCLSCHPDGMQKIEHPEDRFPISEGDHRYACVDCHKRELGASTGGANVDCVGCHDGAHTEALAAVRHANTAQYYFDPRSPSFCRACHPDGQSKVAHPEGRFAITSGPHRYTCFDCHTREPGVLPNKDNTDCVGCHAKAHGEEIAAIRHARVPEYVFAPGNPDFCLDCHAAGTQP
jgi:hypothetical protein